MDKRTAIETDLKAAQSELEALCADLPQFHALLTDNEADGQRLKSERASLDAQSQVKGRVSVAKEMLEQHQSDIQAARAEVERLEALSEREHVIAELTVHAEASLSAKGALGQALTTANAALERGIQSVLAKHTELSGAASAFAAVGADAALVAELAARGVTIAQPDITRGLPQPYGQLIWSIVLSQIEQRAQAALMVEIARRRALAKQAVPALPPKVELLFGETDVYAAIKRLGDLVLQEVGRGNGFLGKPDQVGLVIWEADLQDARERLQGAGPSEVARYA